MASTREEYLEGLVFEANEARLKGKKAIYRCNAKIPDDWAEFARNYFNSQPGYRPDFRKCASCKNTWDIIIFF